MMTAKKRTGGEYKPRPKRRVSVGPLTKISPRLTQTAMDRLKAVTAKGNISEGEAIERAITMLLPYIPKLIEREQQHTASTAQSAGRVQTSMNLSKAGIDSLQQALAVSNWSRDKVIESALKMYASHVANIKSK